MELERCRENNDATDRSLKKNSRKPSVSVAEKSLPFLSSSRCFFFCSCSSGSVYVWQNKWKIAFHKPDEDDDDDDYDGGEEKRERDQATPTARVDQSKSPLIVVVKRCQISVKCLSAVTQKDNDLIDVEMDGHVSIKISRFLIHSKM